MSFWDGFWVGVIITASLVIMICYMIVFRR